MNKNQRIVGSILVTALVLASAVVIFSQQKPPAEGAVVFQREKTIQGVQEPPPVQRPGDDTFYYVTSEMSFDGKLVKGAPYSAQAVTEMTQTLSDGNRIVNKSSVSLYRDSEGRTRREQTLRAIGPFATASEPPTTIFINDPVAGATYMLDARTHIARKMPTVRLNYMDSLQVMRARVPAPPGGAIAPMLPPGSEGKAEVERSMVMSAPAPGPEGGAVFEFRRNDARKAKHESLGKQSVEGVEAEGTRETVTIPAGEVGNELPIEIINERWYSPALQTIVMTKHSDPRFGETVYRLTNIDRSEPAKTLFEVPADYTVKAPPMGIGSGVGGGVGSGIGSESGTTIVGAVPAPKAINGGVMNGKANSLPLPQLPAIAKQAGASGTVTVQITIDEDGNVIAAQATSGHPLLRAAAVSAAREAKFSPTKLGGQPVKVQGVLIYNFGNE
jgi:TonB family protein